MSKIQSATHPVRQAMPNPVTTQDESVFRVLCTHEHTEERWELSSPAAHGSYDTCVKFLEAFVPPRGFEFDIQSLSSGRLMSYWVNTTARIARLSTLDFGRPV